MEEIESALEVTPASTPFTAELRPALPAGTMDVEDAVELLRGGLDPHIVGLEEKVTFEVRPGITLIWDRSGRSRIVEVLLKDRVMGFSVAQIAQKVEAGTLENFCQGVLGKVRS